MRLRAACFERVPQFLQRAELTGGVCEISALLRGCHRAAQRDGVGDTVLQLRHHSQVGIRRLLAAEGESAFGVVVVGHGIAVHRYGFGFCEHRVFAVCEWRMVISRRDTWPCWPRRRAGRTRGRWGRVVRPLHGCLRCKAAWNKRHNAAAPCCVRAMALRAGAVELCQWEPLVASSSAGHQRLAVHVSGAGERDEFHAVNRVFCRALLTVRSGIRRQRVNRVLAAL